MILGGQQYCVFDVLPREKFHISVSLTHKSAQKREKLFGMERTILL